MRRPEHQPPYVGREDEILCDLDENKAHHRVHHRRRNEAVKVLREGLVDGLDRKQVQLALEHLLGVRDEDSYKDSPYPGPDDEDLRARDVL